MGKSVYSDSYQRFISVLKDARKDAGYTQDIVAERIGKPQSYVSKVENGERRIDVIELKELADLYQKPLEYFVE